MGTGGLTLNNVGHLSLSSRILTVVWHGFFSLTVNDGAYIQYRDRYNRWWCSRSNVNEKNLNNFGRFGALKDLVDKTKTKAYFD